MLSIEPVVAKTGQTVGPAFFTKESLHDRDFDPAMCKFEAAINIITNKMTPNKNDLPRTPLALKGKADSNESKTSIGFFYIEDRVYQVDLGGIIQVEVELSPDELKPPCLLIHFSTCILRIFSLFGMAAEQFAVLNGAKTRLISLISSEYISSFPSSHGDITSPFLGSSQKSSSEPGQKQPEMMVRSEDGPDADSPPSSEKQNSKDCLEKCTEINKCQMSYQKSLEDLQSLNRLLETTRTPEQSSLRKRNSPSVDRDTLSSLLNSMADNMSSSFCTQGQLSDSVQTHNQCIKTYHTELDQILSSVWTKRPKKRARLSSGSTKQHDSSNAGNQPQQKPQDVLVAQIKDIMMKTKGAIKSKYALSILPRRG